MEKFLYLDIVYTEDIWPKNVFFVFGNWNGYD